MSVAMFDPPNEEAIRKIANPFREPGVVNVNPALPLDESLKMMEKMQANISDTSFSKYFSHEFK